MEPIKQIWTVSYNGGEGDGFYNGPAGSYRAGSNLETKQLENGATICNALVATSDTYTGDITAVNPYEEKTFCTDDAVGDNGKVYYQGAFTFNIGTGSQDRVYGFGKMIRLSDTISYSYGFSGTSSGVGKIYRFASNFASKTDVGTRTLGMGRTTLGANDKIITLSIPGRIIFATANTIFEISNSEVITKLLELPKEANIIEITTYQDTYKVYYNLQRFSNGTTDSFIANWDGFDNVFSGFVKYEASPIRLVVNDGPYDYVSFGDNYTTDLYYVGGLNRGKPIRTNIEDSTNNTRVFGTEGVIREGVLYMTGENKLGEDCLYSYGNYYPGTNNQLVPENKGKQINKMSVSERVIYCYIDDDVSANTGKIYTKSFFYASQPETTATIYTYALTGNYGISTEKTIENIHIPYLMYHSSDHIKIYYKKTGGPYSSNTDGRTLIKDITGATDLAKRGCIVHRNELSALLLGNFYQLEYKIEIIAGSTKSPILWSIKTVYSDNLKQ